MIPIPLLHHVGGLHCKLLVPSDEVQGVVGGRQPAFGAAHKGRVEVVLVPGHLCEDQDLSRL